LSGNPQTVSGTYSLDLICKTWLCKPYDGSVPVSRFLAERLSFSELTFRIKEEKVSTANVALPQRIREADLRSARRTPGAFTLPGKLSDGIRAENETMNAVFRQNVEELNTVSDRRATASIITMDSFSSQTTFFRRSKPKCLFGKSRRTLCGRTSISI
jgi:hypothetical protein